MPRSVCDPCCNPIELAREINSYRAAVLQILCTIAGGESAAGCCATFGAALPASGIAAGASDGTNMVPLLVDGSGNLKVSVTGSGGGTSSAFAAAFPATGTAVGYTDGTNMRGAKVFDGDTGAGAEYIAGANLRISGNGGSIEAKGQQLSANSIPVVIASDQTINITADSKVDLDKVLGTATAVGNGTTNAGTQRVTISSDSTGQVAIAAGSAVIGHVITDSGSTTAVTGNVTVVQGTGTNLHAVMDSGSTTAVTGNVTVVQGTGTNLHAVLDSGSTTTVTQATGTNLHAVLDSGSTTVVTGNVTVVQATGTNLHAVLDSSSTTTVTQATGTNLHAVIDSGSTTAVTQATASSLNAQVVGDVANDGVDAGNPVKIGGQARITNPTAVADGDRVNATFDKLGKQICVSAIRVLKSMQVTTITSSTGETTIITSDSTNFLDVYGLILANTSATATKVTIKDATGGSTRAIFQVPAGDTRGFMLDPGSAVPQAANNNNWTATCGTSVADLIVTAFFVKNL